MAHPNPYPRCIFCGEKANSREHAIPKWMSKRLRFKRMLHPGPANVPIRKHAISFASFRARIFCEPCNKHFKKLEDTIIPILVPMANGRFLSVGDEEQRVLALWGAKTALALLAASSPDIHGDVPKAHHDSIRYSDVPHSDVWVGYLPWRGDTAIIGMEGDAVPIHAYPAPGDEHSAYISFFAFPSMALKVVGFRQSLPPLYRIDGRGQSVCQVWPSIEHVPLLAVGFCIALARRSLPWIPD